MRILLAEDDPIIAMALACRLRRLGHEVLGPAYDGRQAVEEARRTQPQLYLFDIDLPELDGLAAAQQLADEGLRRPVVAITGKAVPPGFVEHSIERGIAAFLTKPVDERELDTTLRLVVTRQGELEEMEAELTRARRALEERKLVEHAKGLLIEALGLSEPEALRRLRRLARDRNVTLAEVARAVVDQQRLLAPDRSRN